MTSMMTMILMMMMTVVVVGVAPCTYDPFTYSPFYLPVVGKRVGIHYHHHHHRRHSRCLVLYNVTLASKDLTVFLTT